MVHFIDEDGDYSWDIVIKRETVRFPEAKRVPLTPKAMKLISEGPNGLDKCDLDTLINLIRNHETFVEPKLRKRFARDLKDGERLLTSIFDSVIADFLRSLISRYWSPSAGAETRNAKEAEEKATVMRELLDGLAFETMPEMLCSYVDALGYLYSKGHCFIGECDDEVLNELTRFL